MKHIVTGDETWVYKFDMQTSQQASEWRFPTEPKPKKPRRSRSKVKVMLNVFFDYRDVKYSEFLSEGQTIIINDINVPTAEAQTLLIDYT
jgi:[histone H3]-lysine36 N-dimethyltransferase SETMAR